MRLISWILSLFLAFSMGTGYDKNHESDSELANKIQDHLDIIVDESAAIVDDVIDEIRGSEKVQKAEEFIDDVKDIAGNTIDDIHDHFDEEEDEDETVEETAAETVLETEEETTEETTADA